MTKIMTCYRGGTGSKYQWDELILFAYLLTIVALNGVVKFGERLNGANSNYVTASAYLETYVSN